MYLINVGTVNYFATIYALMSFYSFGNLAEKRPERQKDIIFEIFRLIIGIYGFRLFPCNKISEIIVETNSMSFLVLLAKSVFSNEEKNKMQ